MSDRGLVQQLRLEKRELTWRAADAIERLTRECEKAFTAMRVFERYRELEAQIAATTTRAAAAERKVEKLRAALQEIANTFDDTWHPSSVEGMAGDTARAALDETEKGDE